MMNEVYDHPLCHLEDLSYEDVMKNIQDMEEDDAQHDIYLFFKKTTQKLYAWTNKKEMKKRFIHERGKGSFYIKKRTLSENIYRIFLSQNTITQLLEIPLYDGKQWIMVLATNYESDGLDESQLQIQATIDSMYDMYKAREAVYHPRVLKFIRAATSIVSRQRGDIDDTIDEYLEVNTFYLFCHLFIESFAFKNE